MPLENSAKKSSQLRALSQDLRSKAQFQSVLDDKLVEIQTLCEKLKLSKIQAKNSETAFESQKERLELEEKKFRFGRSSTFQLIQAGDDKTQTELSYHQAQVDLRTLSWKVLASQSELFDLIETWKVQQ